MTKIIPIIAFVCSICWCNAQVKIGSGIPHVVDPSALLELKNDLSVSPSNWKTFLPPQVDFTNPVFVTSTTWGVAGTPVTGAVVFNIGTAYSNGFTGPGLYCWMGNRWSPFSLMTDKLRQALTASLPAYDTAGDNTWIMITEAEYNNLSVVVTGAAKYAANDSFMNLPSISGWNQLYTVGGNASVSSIPPFNYIIAWSIRTGSNFTSSSQHSRIKLSGSQLTGYTDYGPALPDYSLDPDTRYYFLLKRPESQTGNVLSFTAIYAFHSKFLGIRNVTPGRDYFTPGNSSTLNNNYSSQSASQYLSTPLKVW